MYLCHGVFGGRLRYSRYAVRPYIGGMYHQFDYVRIIYVLDCFWAHVDPFLLYCDWVCRLPRVGVLLDIVCC